MTALGAFGYLIWDTVMHPPAPAVQRWLADAGYLPCDGGYINTADPPVSISPN